MPLEGSYAIWNNRGGSGKTNLTYHLAIKYAYRNPDKTILVVDMCPQADLSHAFLGRRTSQPVGHTHSHARLFFVLVAGDDDEGRDYVSQIGSLKKDPMILDGQQRVPRTISGYLDIYTSVGLPSNVDPRTFLFNVSKFNKQLPRNVGKSHRPAPLSPHSLTLASPSFRFISYAVTPPWNYWVKQWI